MRVATLEVDGDGSPVVPGAAFVIPADAGWWSVEFEPVGSGGGPHLDLWEIEPGLYAWKGTPGAPDLGGDPFVVWARSAEGRAKHRHYRITGTVPSTDDQGQPITVNVAGLVVRLPADAPLADATVAAPWVMAGATITRAVPSLPSVAGAVRDEDIGGVSPPSRRGDPR